MTQQRAEVKLVLPVGERDHVCGAENAPVTLVQYCDFDCPDCWRIYAQVQGIRQRMGTQLRFVYRYFPLIHMHRYAQHAAEAAEAAGAQGKFWPMHDYLFEHPWDLADAALRYYAAVLHLDTARFARDLGGHVYAPRIEEDVISATHSGVRGTPAFFINGVRFSEEWDPEALEDELRAAAIR